VHVITSGLVAKLLFLAIPVKDMSPARAPRRLITVADDFGLSEGVNDAVEQAAAQGILTSASLMVAAPAFADAVARARRSPNLHVGLHLVVIEGTPILPPAEIPGLVDATGRFPSDQFRLGLKYFFRPAIRRQLAAEIRAQFEAFAATGLPLDHANAHKHMHLHPVIGRLMIEIGRDYGLRAIRIPAEPASAGQTFGNRALRHWCRILRRQARRAGMRTNDHLLGLTQTGHMTPGTVQAALQNLPPGLTEMYFHPATRRDPVLVQLMPGYDHLAELAALMTSVMPPDVLLTSYNNLADAQGSAPEITTEADGTQPG
jgi:hopanoid biosynthesis associated protein HpnK